jgi:chemotaxis protein methyltransferase CheR
MGDYFTVNAARTIMSEAVFSRFSSFVQSEVGIKMPPVKKTMLQARLSKRLRRLGLQTFDEYCDFVFSPEGRATELQNMIDVVTTNKTDFFREPGHFHYLVQQVLPELMNRGMGVRRRLMLWSAGCSTGEEPYTIAMVLSDFAERHRGIDFSILATDLSGQVLKEARLGIYREDEVDPVPMGMKKRYLLRSRNRSEGRVKIVSAIRNKVEFRQLNFMDEEYAIGGNRDVIFCRNVIIYFKRSTQERVLNRVCRHLRTGGYMFMGHSETLNGLNVPLIQVEPTIYRKI